MNFREGVRRAFVALGVVAAILAASLVMFAASPRVEHYTWAQKMRGVLQENVGPSEFSVLDRGSAYDSVRFLDGICSDNVLLAKKAISEVCAEYEAEQSGMPMAWVKQISLALVFGIFAYCAVFLAWRVLDWILVGFSRPTGQPGQR